MVKMSEINKENYLQKIAEISKKKTAWVKDFEESKKPKKSMELKRANK